MHREYRLGGVQKSDGDRNIISPTIDVRDIVFSASFDDNHGGAVRTQAEDREET